MIRTIKKPFITILLALSIGVIVGRYLKPTDMVQSVQGKTVTKKVETVSKDFPVDSVILYMKQLNIKHLEFSFAQLQHETGGFSSNIFKENYNLAGMKVAYQRPTTAIGENRGHAQYLNWRDSVIDFALLQTRILAKTKGKKEYMDYIKNFYSEDSKYMEIVNKHVKKNRECGIFTD